MAKAARWASGTSFGRSSTVRIITIIRSGSSRHVTLRNLSSTFFQRFYPAGDRRLLRLRRRQGQVDEFRADPVPPHPVSGVARDADRLHHAIISDSATTKGAKVESPSAI